MLPAPESNEFAPHTSHILIGIAATASLIIAAVALLSWRRWL